MTENDNQTILVVNDVEATRKSIEALLRRDGYSIETAQGEQDAIQIMRRKNPNLLLVSLDGETETVIQLVRRMRASADSDDNIPIIIFCADGSKENEIAVEDGIFLACPENFNQLRDFIRRLLLRA